MESGKLSGGCAAKGISDCIKKGIICFSPSDTMTFKFVGTAEVRERGEGGLGLSPK